MLARWVTAVLKRDSQLRGDLLARLAVHHERENLKFPLGDAAGRGGTRRLAVCSRLAAFRVPPEGRQVFEDRFQFTASRFQFFQGSLLLEDDGMERLQTGSGNQRRSRLCSVFHSEAYLSRSLSQDHPVLSRTRSARPSSGLPTLPVWRLDCKASAGTKGDM